MPKRARKDKKIFMLRRRPAEVTGQFCRTISYSRLVMQKKDFARRLAHEAHLTPAVAADQIDAVVTRLLRRLKEGKPAEIPGLGTLLPGKAITFQPEEAPKK